MYTFGMAVVKFNLVCVPIAMVGLYLDMISVLPEVKRKNIFLKKNHQELLQSSFKISEKLQPEPARSKKYTKK